MHPQTRIRVVLVVGLVVAGLIAYQAATSVAPSADCAPAGSSATSANSGQHSSAGTDERPPGSSFVEAPGAPRTAVAPSDSPPVIQVVAAEDFWGSLVSQLGGNASTVLSIVTDPNTDPHEYEANASDARAIADAQLVVVNGVGYDDWALSLIAAADSPGQIVLNVGSLNGVVTGGGLVAGNPHMWYNPVYVERTVAAMYSDLVTIQPASAAYFAQNYAALNISLGALYRGASDIRQEFAGVPVASTESIFVYLANYTGLDLISPPAFMEAISEGNDPPAQSVVEFQCQLENGSVRALVYNAQTVTPLTSQMQSIAQANHVPVVAITETIQPPNATYQNWMGTEYQALASALTISSGVT